MKGKFLYLCVPGLEVKGLNIIRSTIYLGNIILKIRLFLCRSSSPQPWSETLSSCRGMQSWMYLRFSRSIRYNRNVNSSIDFLLCLYCLFHFIFLAGNFLIKNPVIETPHKPNDSREARGTQALNPSRLSLFHLCPPPVQDWKLLHFQLRVNACDLQFHRG